MSRWFRHYAGMMRDDKLVRVAMRAKQPVERVVWVWGAILESAAEIDDAGRYELDAPEVAYFLRADEVDIRAIADGLAEAGHVDSNRVVKWGDRQYQSDTSKERQARYRERQRGKNAVGDGERKASDVTPPSRDVAVTPQETETETKVEKEEPNGSSKRNGVRLSPDWELPDEWRQWAVSRGLPPERCDIEATKIRNWSINAKANGAKKDWFRAWQNWVMDAIDKLPKSRGSPPLNASTSSALADSAARLAQTMRSADEIRSGSSGPGIPALIPHLPVR